MQFAFKRFIRLYCNMFSVVNIIISRKYTKLQRFKVVPCFAALCLCEKNN